MAISLAWSSSFHNQRDAPNGVCDGPSGCFGSMSAADRDVALVLESYLMAAVAEGWSIGC